MRWFPSSLHTFSPTYDMNLIQRALQSLDVLRFPDALNIKSEAIENFLEPLDSTPST